MIVTAQLDRWLEAYGYLAVTVLIFIESTGIPSPGETMLIVAGAYAGSTGRLAIALVILAAFAGAVLGDNMGYWIGREGGARLLRRFGRYIGMDETNIKVGLLLFRRHGGKVVFLGRFIPVLRTWGAFLAGVNHYPWPQFLFWNAASGAAWSLLWGLLAFSFGVALKSLAGNVSFVAIGVAAIISLVSGGFVYRARARLRREAEAEFPGPLTELR